MSVLNNIITLLKEDGRSQKELCAYLGITQSAFTDWKSGRVKSWNKYLPQIAEFFEVSVDYLTGKSPIRNPLESNLIMLEDSHITMLPLFESVSAGLGTYANSEIAGYIPYYLEVLSDGDRYFAAKVKGDSMYPRMNDGDIVVVERTESVDSGTIAVVVVDGEEGLVKRVIYDAENITLESINPMYAPRKFHGADVLRVQVRGKVHQIISKL